MDLNDFQRGMSYCFSDIDLLTEALTHPSCNDQNYKKNYQRLEFFGDKVLGLVVCRNLIKNFPEDDEGSLSKRFAYAVSCDNLSKVALDLNVDKVIRMGKGELMSGGNLNKNNLEDSLEAIIGAIYLDSGLKEVERFIIDNFGGVFDSQFLAPVDPVSEFQEIVQRETRSLPEIEVLRVSGPDHSPVFEAKIIVESMSVEKFGQGNSKKDAVKNACIAALKDVRK